MVAKSRKILWLKKAKEAQHFSICIVHIFSLSQYDALNVSVCLLTVNDKWVVSEYIRRFYCLLYIYIYIYIYKRAFFCRNRLNPSVISTITEEYGEWMQFPLRPFQSLIYFKLSVFNVSLTVPLSIIFVIDQLMHKFVHYNKFIICLYMFRALCAYHQEVKIVLYSIWYHHTCRWPSGAQVERGPSLNLCTGRLTTECDNARCCIIQFWSPDDEYIVLETCRGI